MNDAFVLRSSCFELDKHTRLAPARMPEEATTLNFVRRLATASRVFPTFRAGGILHSRQLESAHSKADLELVVRFSRNTWLNLVLQAKSLQYRNGQWRYEYWDSSKNAQLISWCKSQSKVRGYRLTPGMLLYNEDVNEIQNTRNKNPFGACDLTQRYVPPTVFDFSCCWHWCPTLAPGATPAGISMCLDEAMMDSLSKPTLSQLTRSHFPLEHLAHFAADNAASRPRRTEELVFPIHEFLSAEAPNWAYEILEGREPRLRELEQEGAERIISTGYVVVDLS